jgi:hypothetical protein
MELQLQPIEPAFDPTWIIDVNNAISFVKNLSVEYNKTNNINEQLIVDEILKEANEVITNKQLYLSMVQRQSLTKMEFEYQLLEEFITKSATEQLSYDEISEIEYLSTEIKRARPN